MIFCLAYTLGFTEKPVVSSAFSTERNSFDHLIMRRDLSRKMKSSEQWMVILFVAVVVIVYLFVSPS